MSNKFDARAALPQGKILKQYSIKQEDRWNAERILKLWKRDKSLVSAGNWTTILWSSSPRLVNVRLHYPRSH